MPSFEVVARRGAIYFNGHLPVEIFRFLDSLPGFHKELPSGGAMMKAARRHVDLFAEAFPHLSIRDADGTLAKLSIEVPPIKDHPRHYAPSVKPFAHQARALNIGLSRDYFGFFYDMGTGKSSIIINLAAELYARGDIDCALVFTKKRGIPQFIDEQLPEHAPMGLEYEASPFPWKKGSRFSRSKLLFLVASYGSLQSEARVKKLALAIERKRCAVFFDESQMLKSWSGTRVENIKELRAGFRHCFLFSGDPTPLGNIDLFAQFYLMNPNIIGHSSLGSFKNEFCQFGGWKRAQIVGYQNKELLSRLIAPHCEFVKITDCMDMPEQVFHEVRFTPSAEQKRLYASMKEEFVIATRDAANAQGELRRKLCEHAASRYKALQQIACGWFYDENGEITIINDERALFVAEQLVDEGHKTVIWGAHHGDLDSLARAFAASDIEAVEFSGRLRERDNEENKRRFQTDPSVKVLYGTAAAGGTGLNFQMASRMVFFSNTYNGGDRAQAERRIWRAGQKERCLYYDVLGFPIDRQILKNNREKRDLSEQMRNLTGLQQLASEL